MQNNQLIQHSKIWDRGGVLVALFCILHCVLFPFIVILIPTLQFLMTSSILEVLILVLGIGVGSFSFITSYKKHRKWGPIVLGMSGVLFLALNLVLFQPQANHHHHGEEMSFLSHIDFPMVLGGLFLITGHLWNIRECHCFCETSCRHEPHQQ